MTVFLTSAQMRAIERGAIDSGQVSGLDLMERAGRGVVTHLLAYWPDLDDMPQRAVILCGPGNNGGDGFVIAHHLRARGWQVDVFFYGQPEALSCDARQMYQRWAAESPVHALSFPTMRPEELADLVATLSALADPHGMNADRPSVLFVDALFGIGLSRPVQGFDALIQHIDSLRGAGLRSVAVDVPSGLDADTGLYVTGAGTGTAAGFRADLTVTFHALKRGHVEGLGPEVCGTVRIVDIGLDPSDGPPDA